MTVSTAMIVVGMAAVLARLAVVVRRDLGPVPRSHGWETDHAAMPVKAVDAV
ncbi:hypothetical protein [Arthrobacter sp. NPDC089319]|uniref:hypothetical protein n=1 Tax=Arthrobacter sp. NPDC089319 TaxID=3155915 RepID=UPI0034467BF7